MRDVRIVNSLRSCKNGRPALRCSRNSNFFFVLRTSTMMSDNLRSGGDGVAPGFGWTPAVKMLQGAGSECGMVGICPAVLFWSHCASQGMKRDGHSARIYVNV